MVDLDDVQLWRVVVVGQGSGMASLAAARLENLVLLPLQPVERLSDVLATADVAVAVIEPAVAPW